ncbi:MAG: DUF975 family protein [Hespellia sp.]|nr:DUF975 family protein [Hespellia sp.]
MRPNEEKVVWKRKEIKKNARREMKANYWRCVAVCFLLAFLTGAYASSTRMIARQNVDGNNEEVREDEYDAGPQSYFSRYEESHPNAGKRERAIVRTMDEIVTTFVSSSDTQLLIFNMLEDILGNDMDLAFWLLVLSILLKIFYDVFVANILKIGEKRFFMENRLYEHSKINKIIYMYKINYVKRPAWVMFCKDVFQSLWNLTIIGGIIKHYEYAMIPYITAEQPDLERKEVFALSKEMMKGNKWRMFLLDVSFAGWGILGVFTFGALQILFLNPYRAQTYAELYMAIRRAMIRPRAYGYKVFTDKYLDVVPSDDELLISKLVYDEDRSERMKEAVIENGKYPGFLYNIQPKYPEFIVSGKANYSYSFLEYVELFFSASIAGWLVELVTFLLQNGAIVKRGFLTGPWMPIYGFLAISVVILLRRWEDRPVRVFFSSFLLGSAFAYAISWILEYYTGERYWDCSSYFLNIGGRICLENALLYGLAGCVFLYYIAPFLEEHRKEEKQKYRSVLCIVLTICFIIDAAINLMK